jgi:hypothetical protein
MIVSRSRGSDWDPSRKKGVHLKGVHLIGAYISQDGHLRCLYLMGVALLRGMDLIGVHLTGIHLTGIHLTGIHLTGGACYRRTSHRAYISYRQPILAGMYLTGVHLRGRCYLSRPTRIVSPADKLSNCVPRCIPVPRDNITVVPDKFGYVTRSKTVGSRHSSKIQ